MKINSEHLYKYINELATNEKLKFNVYYDDQYITQIYWNGKKFEWEPGKFSSEAFFNPLYDFVVIEEEKKIPEKLPLIGNKIVSYPNDEFIEKLFNLFYQFDDELRHKINEIIDYLENKEGENNE